MTYDDGVLYCAPCLKRVPPNDRTGWFYGDGQGMGSDVGGKAITILRGTALCHKCFEAQTVRVGEPSGKKAKSERKER